jgi:hypothetical protein
LGKLPDRHSLVFVLPLSGSRLRGKQIGMGGASVALWVGEGAQVATLEQDWIATHEFVHLALPSMLRRHLWLNEGLATYVEPFARVLIGNLTPEEAWLSLVDGLPQGLPDTEDTGLDNTQVWGRIYWGGALFWLLTDIAIRERTGNQKAVADVLREVNAEGGTSAQVWTISQFLEVADRAVGTSVVSEMYRAHALDRAWVDLEQLWRELGIAKRGRRVVFDDGSPRAQVRRWIGGK